MIQETDIPCSDCGTELVDRTVYARELSVATDWVGEVTVVECPACEARYYPEETVARLSGTPNGARPLGDG